LRLAFRDATVANRHRRETHGPGIVVTLITDRIIEPRLGAYEGDHPVESAEMSAAETRGLRFAFWA
jgi:p-aminobenzoyl-glutamate transporter AbgT